MSGGRNVARKTFSSFSKIGSAISPRGKSNFARSSRDFFYFISRRILTFRRVKTNADFKRELDTKKGNAKCCGGIRIDFPAKRNGIQQARRTGGMMSSNIFRDWGGRVMRVIIYGVFPWMVGILVLQGSSDYKSFH